MPQRKKPKTPKNKASQKQKQKQKQSVIVNVGQQGPRRAVHSRAPPTQLPKGQMPSFSFHGGTHIQPQSKEPTMFRELYEQEKQKNHFLKQTAELNRLAVAHAQTDNRQMEMSTLAASEHVKVNMHSQPRVPSHLDRFQQQEIEALGELPLQQQTPAEHGTILISLERQLDAVESANPPRLERDEMAVLPESNIERVLHDAVAGTQESVPVFDVHANDDIGESSVSESDASQESMSGVSLLSHEVLPPSALSVALENTAKRNYTDELVNGGLSDLEAPTSRSHASHVSTDPEDEPVEPFDKEASKNALFAQLVDEDTAKHNSFISASPHKGFTLNLGGLKPHGSHPLTARTAELAPQSALKQGTTLNLFEGIGGRITNPTKPFLKTPQQVAAEPKQTEVQNSLESKKRSSKKERQINPGAGLGSGNARGLREGPHHQLGRPTHAMHAEHMDEVAEEPTFV